MFKRRRFSVAALAFLAGLAGMAASNGAKAGETANAANAAEAAKAAEVAAAVAAAKPAGLKPFNTQVFKVHREAGMASFYKAHGKTASGLTGQGTMTAAHRKLPFGSRVRVKDMKTGREVVVVITDRGPFTKSRVIDLSHQAAKELGIVGRGVARVELVSDHR